jgi:pyrophosphatase PpaX
MRFSIVLFDLDGTLIDTNHLIVTSFQHTLREKLGLDVGADEIYPYFGEPLPTTLERYAPGRGAELSDFYRLFNLANHDLLLRQFEGVRSMLAQLTQAGVRLGVVTSKKVEMARRGLRVSEMDAFFETVVGMDEVVHHKPHAEPALLALSRMGAPPSDHVLMVGDSRFDILCGKHAGIKTAAVGWTVQNHTTLAESGPDYWVAAPSQLATLVLGTDQ